MSTVPAGGVTRRLSIITRVWHGVASMIHRWTGCPAICDADVSLLVDRQTIEIEALRETVDRLRVELRHSRGLDR